MELATRPISGLQPDERPFYHVGGTVPWDADCYVNRAADRELLETLSRGDFCYVLTARQMGKSSLMTRTAARLREAGAAVAVVDLTAFGRNLTAEQWYDLILSRVGRELNLEEALEDYWLDHPRLPPLARFTSAIESVLLKRIDSPVILFIDEIDVIRSLPFDTDELLAAIREFYTRRAREPQLKRLSFCLLGVASPSDLIADERITPFNIGKRIELKDFTPDEAAPLAEGFEKRSRTTRARSEAKELLGRVLYWTGGHPYLTQRLCSELVDENPEALPGRVDVDEACARLYFGSRAAETEDNLRFVADRLLKSSADLSHTLDLYSAALGKRGLIDDETDPQIATLRLSGVVRSVDGRLRVRNRIYARVFDGAWVERQRDPAEIRRQRRAYRQGRNRALALAAVVIFLVSGLAIYAFAEARRAELARRSSLVTADALDLASYTASMNLLQRDFESGQLEHVASLLEETRGSRHRGWEWGYWQRRMHLEKAKLIRHSKSVLGGAWSHDSRRVVTWSYDSTAHLWNGSNGRSLAVLSGHVGLVLRAAWSPDDREVLTSGDDGTVRIWESDTGATRAILSGHQGAVYEAAWSPNGKLIASAGNDHTVRLWTLQGGALGVLRGHAGPVRVVAWAPNGDRLLSASEDGSVRIWSAHTRRPLRNLHLAAAVRFASWSPNGTRIAAVSADRSIRIWNSDDPVAPRVLTGHRKPIVAALWSPDGRHLLTGSSDHSVRVWNSMTGRQVLSLDVGKVDVRGLTWSPDCRYFAAALEDYTVRVWKANTGEERGTLKHAVPIRTVAWSPDGRSLLTTGEDGIARIWNAAPQSEVTILDGHTRRVRSVEWSPDGNRLLSFGEDRSVRIWSRTAQLSGVLKGVDSQWLAAAWSPDSKRIATAGQTHSGAIWDAETGQRLVQFRGRLRTFQSLNAPRELSTGTSEVPHSPQRGPRSSGRPDHIWVSWSHDGAHVITAGYDDRISGWDTASGREAFELRPNAGVIFSATWSPVDRFIAAACNDVTTRIWDMSQPGRPAALTAAQGSVRIATWSNDGRQIATSTEESNPRIWIRSREPREVVVDGHEKTVMLDGWIQRSGFRGHNGLIRTIAWDPQNERVVTASEDHTAGVWDARTGARIAQLKGHAGAVLMAEWSPDGRRIATASLDGTARVWDPATGKELVSLKHPAPVWQARWSPDGSRIATGCDDHRARIWVSDPESGE